MAIALTGILSDLSSAIPSSSDILQQVMIGAGASVVLSGLKTQSGMDAIDPLHIIHKDAPNNNPNNIVGATVTASAFAALPPATQATLLASGVHVVSG